MAQVVGYFEDFHTEERRAEAYSEGPFVLVNVNGWRIEVEYEDAPHPCMPDSSIYKLKRKLGMEFGKTHDKQLAESVCDALNRMVKDGRIVRTESGWWKAAA